VLMQAVEPSAGSASRSSTIAAGWQDNSSPWRHADLGVAVVIKAMTLSDRPRIVQLDYVIGSVEAWRQ
jgi:hypothetical protein